MVFFYMALLPFFVCAFVHPTQPMYVPLSMHELTNSDWQFFCEPMNALFDISSSFPLENSEYFFCYLISMQIDHGSAILPVACVGCVRGGRLVPARVAAHRGAREDGGGRPVDVAVPPEGPFVAGGAHRGVCNR